MRLPIEEAQIKTAGIWDHLVVDWWGHRNTLYFKVYRTIQKEGLAVDSVVKIGKDIHNTLLDALVKAQAEANKAWLLKSSSHPDKHTFLDTKDSKMEHNGQLILGPDTPDGLTLDEIEHVLEPVLKRIVREVKFIGA